jgi:hypothetical protein
MENRPRDTNSNFSNLRWSTLGLSHYTNHMYKLLEAPTVPFYSTSQELPPTPKTFENPGYHHTQGDQTTFFQNFIDFPTELPFLHQQNILHQNNINPKEMS